MGLGGSDATKKAASGVYTFIPPKGSISTIIIPKKEEIIVFKIPEIVVKKEVVQPKETPVIVQPIKHIEVKKEQPIPIKPSIAEKKNIQPVKVSNYVPKPNVYIPTREYREMLKQVKKSRRR